MLAPMTATFGTAEHWRERAAEAYAIAEQMNDPDAKRSMLEIAERYESLAKYAEAQALGIVPPMKEAYRRGVSSAAASGGIEA